MDFVSSWSTVHSHPSKGSSLSPDLCRWIRPTLDLITLDQSEVRPEKRGQRRQTLKALRPEHVVKCSRLKGGLYCEPSLGIPSGSITVYCQRTKTFTFQPLKPTSLGARPTMAHPCWPSFSWARLAFHSQSAPASAVSNETWGQVVSTKINRMATHGAQSSTCYWHTKESYLAV